MQDQLNETFFALSDPTRRAILERLSLGEATAGELAAPFGISKPAVSKHLKVLQKAKLIIPRKDAQWRRQSLNAEALKAAASWISKYQQFWESRFDALTVYLEKTSGEEKEDDTEKSE
ncbi:MAG: metalloregulator ArsR/SmtB family transcription factor [Nitrospirota bacterium]|nr:metalloregulator ArsR/SmtB family transcription factor [Nitrospirota bacterium]NOY85588.1 winged helix-turn-helix transcriptional regulator [Candidatus Manganitrophaceae bacterium]